LTEPNHNMFPLETPNGSEAGKVKLFSIELTYDECINYAVQQNAVPVIKQLVLRNNSEVVLNDLKIKIISDPVFSVPWQSIVAQVNPHCEYSLNDLDIQLSATYLSSLQERTKGFLKVSVSSGDKEIIEQTFPVDLLAYDEWSGIHGLPEILAAFVMPNLPSVEDVLKSASVLLQNWTQDGSLSGYQTHSPKRCWITAAAIYAAIQKQKISYINPPASFESTGQKIRTPERVISSKLGTCLDLAVLFASCFEQAGLNPILLIHKGHAYCGLWLLDETFPLPAVDDLQTIRKRVVLKELTVFEATALTSVSQDFLRAEKSAENHLENDIEFIYAIDIAAARRNRILPLPQKNNQPISNMGDIGTNENIEPQMPIVPDFAIGDPIKERTEEKTNSLTRLDKWKSKLLDLSLRNRLLNFKETKMTIPVLCPNLGKFEDALADGRTFTFLPKPPSLGGDDPRNIAVFQARTGKDPLSEYLTDQLNSDQLHSSLEEKDLANRLLQTYRGARTALEEGGANVCFLALGQLAWKDPADENRTFIAPILMVPVELTRKSVQQGFQLRGLDDETRINITLLQMLKVNFDLNIGGLDPLPRDESGIDVLKVFNILRNAIRDIKGWEIRECVNLGLFSFTKFLMWKDLAERTKDLMDNAVVAHLINNGDKPYPTSGDLPDPDTLDIQRSPQSTFCPLDADSSQLAAVFAAADGKSFVMEGPPGTGKSQTITNMITQCLAMGKTVLFVAEKMAALSVVKRRLEKVGLGAYCLELHSNKARKKEVLEQLETALASRANISVADWDAEASELFKTKADLNNYANTIHAPGSNGLTAYRVLSRLVAADNISTVPLRWNNIDVHSRTDLKDLYEIVEAMSISVETCNTISKHPWKDCNKVVWGVQWARDIADATLKLQNTLQPLENSLTSVSKVIGIQESGCSLNELVRIETLLGCLLDAPYFTKPLLISSEFSIIKTQIEKIVAVGKQRDMLRGELLVEFDKQLLKIDPGLLLLNWKKACTAWWPISWFKKSSIQRLLRSVHKQNKKLRFEIIPQIINKAIELNEKQTTIENAPAELNQSIGALWNDGDGRWEDIVSTLSWVEKLRNTLAGFSISNPTENENIKTRISDLALNSPEGLKSNSPLGHTMLTAREGINNFLSAVRDISALLDLNSSDLWGGADNADAIGNCKISLRNWIGNESRLREWCAWRTVCSNAAKAGLQPLIDGIEKDILPAKDLRRVFESSYYRWWLDMLIEKEPVLRDFFGAQHARKIDKFKNLDKAYLERTKKMVFALLASKIPSATGVSSVKGSELGTLSREIQKKARHLPVRRLVELLPNVLPRLKPCFLMSPLSVAQYLDPKYEKFDLVIFDEASQIPVWDSVGAIARGKQVVIAGDPKQLPPTNFFNKEQGDDEPSEEIVEDLESILDECLGANLPKVPLRWHYRSEHESLISFSNNIYYKNSLYTFPSPTTKDTAVSIRYVAGGIYDRGKSTTNRKEAEAVVDEIIKRLEDPVLCKQSIGVVTFNQAQQTLIEDILESARVLRPHIDSYFSPDLPEPLFVKNLENVQGDERDIILFSICFAKDIAGNMSLNFGPLNKSGGERRLNVAITRARKQVVVFSSIYAEDIDIRRTQARGVRDLQLFLDFAKRGQCALVEAKTLTPLADFESPFEIEVHDALVNRGWKVDLQVGCSCYRIDLAVVDNNLPGKYLIGIECDGANYHSAKTARDRDRLRQSVLEGLGWTLHRIWSTDWWANKKQQIDKLDAILKELQTNSSAIPLPSVSVQPIEPENKFDEQHVKMPDIKINADKKLVEYQLYKACPFGLNQDNFYDTLGSSLLKGMIENIVGMEGPICKELLQKRIVNILGFARTGNVITKRIQSVIPVASLKSIMYQGRTWYWPNHVEINNYSLFRVPGQTEESQRQITDIVFHEIANAVNHTLGIHFSLPIEDLGKLTAKLLGGNRLTSLAKEYVLEGINHLVRSQRAEVRNGVVVGKGIQ
jgi:very-short-patch-repair endonuclease